MRVFEGSPEKVFSANPGRATVVLPRSWIISPQSHQSCHELQPGSHLCRETGMEIAIQSSDELEQLRTRLRKMSDDELMRKLTVERN
jgi:hypothetical protein